MNQPTQASQVDSGAVAVSFASLGLSGTDRMQPDGAMVNERAFIADLASISKHVAVFSPTSDQSKLLVDKSLGISYYCIHPPKVYSLLRSSQMLSWSVFVLIQILHLDRGQRRIASIRGPIQAVVMNFPLRLFRSFVIYRCLSVPLVHKESELGKRSPFTRLLLWSCDAIALTTANLIVVSSRKAYDEVLQFIPWARDRLAIVPFSRTIQSEGEAASRRTLGNAGKSTMSVGYVGSFNSLYSFATLVDSMELLNGSCGKEVRLVIAGKGPLRGDLMEMLGRKGLMDRLDDFGVVPHEKIAQVYRRIDVLVVPFRSGISGEPIKAFEAFRSGTPVVLCTNSPHERFRDGINCLIVRPEDPTSLARAIERICTDSDLRRNLVENGYGTIREMQGQVEAFLSTLANKFSEGK